MTEHGTSPTSHGTSGGTQDRAGPGPWSQEPRTVTGRRLFTDNDPMDMLESDGVTWGDVVAIEREAAPLPQTAVVFRVVRERFGYGADADDLIRALLPGLTPPGDRK